MIVKVEHRMGELVARGGFRPHHLLSPGLENFAVGQDIMGIFRLVDFARDDHLTLRMKPETTACRVFGDVTGTYQVVAQARDACRLLAKFIARYPPGVVGWAMSLLLPIACGTACRGWP